MGGWGRNTKPRDLAVQPGKGIYPPPELVFCPTPGTPDWPALSEPDTLRRLAGEADGLQLYGTHLLRHADFSNQNGQNSWMLFRDLEVLNRARELGMTLQVETTALKPFSDQPSTYIGHAREILETAALIGVKVDRFAFDEPFCAGFEMMTPPWDFVRVVEHVRAVQAGIRETAPEMSFTLIEPYPSVTLETIRWAIEALTPAALRVDVDYNHAKQVGTIRQLQDAVVSMSQRCQEFGARFEVCVWGCDEQSDATFMASALRLFAAVQDAVFEGRMPWPDLVIQSWSPDGGSPKTIPRTLPASEPTSLWGLLRTVRGAL